MFLLANFQLDKQCLLKHYKKEKNTSKHFKHKEGANKQKNIVLKKILHMFTRKGKRKIVPNLWGENEKTLLLV
jgi:hypothetical protein